MADVTILGAGISGLTLAWSCLQRGAKVHVHDIRAPGAGASGGIVGALAPHVPENWNSKKAFQLESLMMAETFWAEVAAESGRDPGYRRGGRLQPIADGGALLLARSRSENARVLWQGKARWDVVSAADVGPFAPQSAGGWFVHDTLSARLAPKSACAALVAAIKAGGGRITTGQEPPESHGAIVHATGFEGLLALNDATGAEVGNGVKGQAALLEFDAGNAPQLFSEGVHFVPHHDGTLAIGSTSEREFDTPDSCDTQLEKLIEKAKELVPVIAGSAVLSRWAGVRPRAKSRGPLIGAWPGRDATFIVNGGFKIGFGMAPKIAQVMADLILEGVDNIPEDFSTGNLMVSP